MLAASAQHPAWPDQPLNGAMQMRTSQGQPTMLNGRDQGFDTTWLWTHMRPRRCQGISLLSNWQNIQCTHAHYEPDGQLTVPGGPNQALTLRTSPSPRAQYWGSWMSPASAGICSNSGCCAR